MFIGRLGANLRNVCSLNSQETYAPIMWFAEITFGMSTSAHFCAECLHSSIWSSGCFQFRANVLSLLTIDKPAGAGLNRTYLLPALLSLITVSDRSITFGLTRKTQICR